MKKLLGRAGAFAGVAGVALAGSEVIVTSGAIGAGCGVLGYETRPTSLPERQACAAAGQVELMKLYSQSFKRLKPARAVGQLSPRLDAKLGEDVRKVGARRARRACRSGAARRARPAARGAEHGRRAARRDIGNQYA